MKEKKILFLKKSRLALYFVLLFLSLSPSNQIDAKVSIQNIKNMTDEEDEIKKLKLIAVGDNLIHSSVYKNGKKNGIYNFDSFFENVKDELEWADIKVINQETILVKNENDYSGYPRFGSPYEIGDAIAKAGFNVVLHATNHSYDKGLKGLKETFSFWDQYKDQVTVLGIHKDNEDYNKIKIIEVNGIKVALLNYTYGLNGLSLPKDKQYLVDTLYDKDKVIKDITKAEKLGDITIVFPHWGQEYVYDENKYQKDYAYAMAEAGADLIIGTHPHVLQPLKYIETKDQRTVPVYYSLGNFISAQNKDPRMLGGMAKVIITDNNGQITLDCKIEPIVTHFEPKKPYTAYMLKDYTDDLGTKHKQGLTLDYLYNLYNDIVEDKDKLEQNVYKKRVNKPKFRKPYKWTV
ncbi:MAG TPA: CapA family protein [Mollicutes bacterium]|nr:CapA family protein [Mollicutes bacterium]